MKPTVITGGVIRTLDSGCRQVEALAISGKEISAVVDGTHVDLRGRAVLPAFTDGHVHFPSWSLAQQSIKLDGTTSREEVLARIRAGVNAKAAWIRARGF